MTYPNLGIVHFFLIYKGPKFICPENEFLYFDADVAEEKFKEVMKSYEAIKQERKSDM